MCHHPLVNLKPLLYTKPLTPCQDTQAQMPQLSYTYVQKIGEATWLAWETENKLRRGNLEKIVELKLLMWHIMTYNA